MKKDTDFACIYHCDFGNPDRFGQMLTNINNHLSVYEFDPMRIKIVIVAHGAGLKFFLEDLTGTAWEKDKIDEEQLLNAALEAGADDMNDDGSAWEIMTAPEAFEGVRDAVKALGVEPASAEVAMVPQNYVKLTGNEAKQIEISREDIAQYIGTATESLIRTLSDFKAEKLIEIREGKIIIPDTSKLRNLLY